MLLLVTVIPNKIFIVYLAKLLKMKDDNLTSNKPIRF